MGPGLFQAAFLLKWYFLRPFRDDHSIKLVIFPVELPKPLQTNLFADYSLQTSKPSSSASLQSQP